MTFLSRHKPAPAPETLLPVTVLPDFNEAAVQLWGRRPEPAELWCGSWRLYWSDGRPMRHDECPMAICLKEQREVRGYEAMAERPDGTTVWSRPIPARCAMPKAA